MITIYYGIHTHKINITPITSHLINDKNIIIIPTGDKIRNDLFSDPLPKKTKYIIVQFAGQQTPFLFDSQHIVYIDLFLMSKILFTPKLLIRGYISPKNNIQYPKNVFPITFCIPEEKILTSVPTKKKMLSTLIPWNKSTYIFNSEGTYYNEYRNSMFGITCLKAGWDCMRHYELMANGCIPYFLDIQECPKNTMSHLPKDLLIKGNELYHKYHSADITNKDLLNECNHHIQMLLDYTRQHLTTETIANYVLQKTGHENINNILYIGTEKPDYLSTLVLHGLKLKYGTNCHDIPRQDHIYKTDHGDISAIWGKGISYSKLLESTTRNVIFDATFKNDIKNQKYDLIIFSDCHGNITQKYYEFINSIYDASKIVLFCGRDIHDCEYIKTTTQKHSIFIRELQ